jgi:hypothetical protein
MLMRFDMDFVRFFHLYDNAGGCGKTAVFINY